MLTETLEELQSIVQQKSNILQSDRHELLRQLHEILFVQEFLRLQAKEAEPLEFLQLNNGHAQLKEAIQKTYPKVSTDLFSDATPIILKDRPRLEYNQSNTQLKDTQNLKVSVKNVHDKAVNNLENFRLSQKPYSSKFREVLMNSRARPGEHALFNQNKSMLELQNQIPQPLLALDG